MNTLPRIQNAAPGRNIPFEGRTSSRRAGRRRTCRAIQWALCGVVGFLAIVGTGARARPGDWAATLERKVMVGYQGWYRTPGDESGLGWWHYGKPGTEEMGPGSITIDFWPDLSDFGPEEKFPTQFRHADGSVAEVFSSLNAKTVDRHFSWMQSHGIDGVLIQRFPAAFIAGNEISRRKLRSMDTVLRYAIAAAEKYHRSLAVMYDLTGLRNGAMDCVAADWKHLVDEVGLLRSPAYQFHRGKPLVGVWGVGFDDNRAYTLEESESLVDFLKLDAKYGGNAIMLGIPTWWRTLRVDAIADPRLHAVLLKADILSPWTPGRFHDVGGVRVHARNFWRPDRLWCDQHGLDYMPVLFPGFSWFNLTGSAQRIGRDDGRFLWEQYKAASELGIDYLYQAMFDEMDEGTQIFKTTNTPPVGASLQSYAPLSSDYYLWLVQEAGGRWRRGKHLPEVIPRRAGHPGQNDYLAHGNAVAYRRAKLSFETQLRFFEISDQLMQRAAGTTIAGPAPAKVRLEGSWNISCTRSIDPQAAIAWQLPVPSAGRYRVEVRYPGNFEPSRATAAQLSVLQSGHVIAEAAVDLTASPWEWIKVASVQLPEQGPCDIVLAQGSAPATLPLFEPRLIPDR